MLRPLFLAAIAGGALLFSPAFAQSSPKDVSRAPAGTYDLDPAHSQVVFGISHLELTIYHARFDRLSGTLSLDPAEPQKSATAITISMDSVDTPSPQLNDILKGPNFFQATQFPTATFKSTAIERTGPDTGKIIGDLTIRGVTKPVTLDVTFNGGKPNPIKNAYALGFSARTTIKRSDFGLTDVAWSPFVGDEVQLVIEAMFEQEKE